MGNCRSAPAPAQRRPSSQNNNKTTQTVTSSTTTTTRVTQSAPSSSSPVSRKPNLNKRPKPPPLNAAAQETARPATRNNHSNKPPAPPLSAAPTRTQKVTHYPPPASSPPSKIKKPTIPVAAPKTSNTFSQGDPSRWKLLQDNFAGAAQYMSLGHQELVKGQSIQNGMQTFRQNPAQYVAMTYQTSCLDWPVEQQQYTLIHRQGTDGYTPQGITSAG